MAAPYPEYLKIPMPYEHGMKVDFSDDPIEAALQKAAIQARVVARICGTYIIVCDEDGKIVKEYPGPEYSPETYLYGRPAGRRKPRAVPRRKKEK